jgi:hypothetical protein
MPLPTQIDQCLNVELAKRPTERDANGTVNKYLVSDCVKGAKMSDQEVPIEVSVTISRMTGELTIQRRQDNNSQHDTLCTTVHVCTRRSCVPRSYNNVSDFSQLQMRGIG